MLNGFFEWWASKRDPRVAAYREARLRYEEYIATVGVPFRELTDEHHRRALADESLQRAEELYQRALDLSRMDNALGDVATARYQLGLLFHLQGRSPEAASLFQESLVTLESLPWAGRQQQSTISDCYYHLGVIAWRQGYVSAAARHLGKALSIAEKSGDLVGVAVCRAAFAHCDPCVDSRVEETGGDVTRQSLGHEEALSIPPSHSGADDDLDGPRAGQAETETPASDSTSASDHHHSANDAASEPVEREARDASSYSRYDPFSEILWVLSHSAGANEAYFAPLKELASRLPRQLRVWRIALSGVHAGQAAPPPLAADERLCGAVVVVEREGLENAAFRVLVEWCITQVTVADDFRLFVCLEDGLTPADMHQRGEAGDPLCKRLADVVQLLEVSSPKRLQRAVSDYLSRLDDVRTASRWRQLSNTTRITVGRLALAVQLLALGAVALGTVGFGVFGADSALARLTATFPQATGLVIGLLLFPGQAPALYLLLRGFRSSRVLEQNNRLRMSFVAGLVLITAAGWLLQQAAAPWPWTSLGLVLGILVDAARRSKAAALRQSLSLQQCLKVSTVRRIPLEIDKAAHGIPLNPLTCPLLAPDAPWVFISYSRPLAWSNTIALRLAKGLERQGITCSLDRLVIKEGDNWIRELHRHLSGANVLVMFIELETVNRQWVAAELISALLGRYISGLPEIILLMRPDISGASLEGGLPVFRSVLDSAGATDACAQRARVIVVRDPELTEQAVVHGLRRWSDEAPVLVPPRWSFLAQIMVLPFILLGVPCELLGIPAIVFAVLESWERFRLSEALSSYSVLNVAYVCCAFWLGFGARLTAAIRFELRRPDRGGAFWVHLVGSAGFALLLAQWAGQVPALIIGWAVAISGFGWIVARSYVRGLIRKRSTLGRDRD